MHIAMDWAGQKTGAVFRRYDIPSGSDLANAAEKLTAYVEAQSCKAKQRGAAGADY